MTSRRAVLCLALVCHGCTTPGTPEPVEPIEPAKPPAPVEPEEPAAPAEAEAGPRFWVANGGLKTYDLDGKRVASQGDFGDWAIRMSDGRVVALSEGGERLKIAVVDADGERGSTLELPTVFDAATCQPRVLRPNELEEAGAADDWDAFPLTLELQSGRDFRLSEGERFVCLTLMDRNANMSDYEVSVTVDLAAGTVAAALTLDLQEQCGETEEHPACAGYELTRAWVDAPEAEPATWPLRFEQGFLLDEAGTPIADLCPPGVRDDPEFNYDWGLCPDVEVESSSGRWLMLTGNISEGDYIHREPVLLDRATGELWRIFEVDGEERGYRWVQTTADDLFGGEVEGYPVDLVGESQVEALPEDRFWIDGRLLIPERQAVVEIGGTLVEMVTRE